VSCAAPITRGAKKGQPATGTIAGWQRHYRHGEPACLPCRAARRAYANANREQIAAYQRRWREANPGKDAEYGRRWRQANPETQRTKDRRWRQANPEKKAEKDRRHRARKAAALTIPFIPEQLAGRMAYWGNCCWMCGGLFEEVDHVIPLALGGPHVLANLRPACKSCNASKGPRRVA
jgi:5-methylcytosine-specific restriction endonuclease McrA